MAVAQEWFAPVASRGLDHGKLNVERVLVTGYDQATDVMMSGNLTQAEEGFVYVATGDRYVSEAAVSAATLRRHHPTARICLITDKARGDQFWNDLVLLEKPAFGFRDKIQMHRAPYTRCIFLDTDTTVIGDLSQLFTILTRYDVCGVQFCEGQDYVMEGGIPAAFSEMNGGMIGFRRGASTQEMFTLWARFYEEFYALNKDNYHWANVGDQKSLRAALWHSNVRHFGVGAEFNFIPFKVELASLPVAVLHTRTAMSLEPLARRLNAQLGRRVYLPTFNSILFDSMTGPELPRLAVATTKLLLRAASRVFFPRRMRDWLRTNPGLKWIFGNIYTSPTEGGQEKWEVPPVPLNVSKERNSLQRG